MRKPALFIILIAVSALFWSCQKKEQSTANRQHDPGENTTFSEESLSSAEFFEESREIENSYVAEISDLNGTWQPDLSYKITLKMSEEERGNDLIPREFSWGTGMSILNTTIGIDITDDVPVILDPGYGEFNITEITHVSANSIKVNAYRGNLSKPEYCWFVEITFHFIDKDTLWIECEDFQSQSPSFYGKNALWHRFSGPTQ